ncbi:AraC family transcriptional regulator [Streptomyces sp. Ru73]|uniref:DNA-3-methyladenine glycosylase 2 family protein n=1 Tax=Streptomyces sp. Ru73 TaxID=2080748 RepID=UPI000CDE3B10|nr:AlkA N-terminal domain-containing protein [Streptomyces sp. Ru73]POX37307.1 AraC family transcriptional regulator [Streptomyces sp. Ru73]
MEDESSRYEAVASRDARFDGEFFFAVVTTGIYCRPSCPAVTPKRENVRFFPSAAAAQGAGFRACRRCRPDAVPGSAGWNVRADLVGRAMRLIDDGVVDRDGVAGLAARLGYSPRQVQRQLTAELGAGPVALARARRAHTARILLQTTALPVTELAFAAGFASVRQFNATMREIYGSTPSDLRAAARGRTAGTGHGTPGGIPLRLAFRGPYAAREIFDDLAEAAVPGIEEVTGAAGARTYRRTLRLTYGTGIAEVGERPGRSGGRAGSGWLDCRLHLTDLRDLPAASQRLRRLFDLDADPYAVAARLSADPLLRPLVAARPGLRSPGAADPAEQAVRTVLGGGPERAAALVRAYGKPLDTPDGTLTHLFPAPAELAGADVAAGVRALCAALADGTVDIGAGADRDAAERALAALPGVGPAAAAVIRRRALGDPDVGPPDAGPEAERRRPWRSYALQHLRHAGRTAAAADPAEHRPETHRPEEHRSGKHRPADHPEASEPKDTGDHAALHAA